MGNIVNLQNKIYEICGTHTDVERVETWLCLKLSNSLRGINPGALRDADFRRILVNTENQEKAQPLLRVWMNSLLPNEKLNWIFKDERQVEWLNSYISRNLDFLGFQFPPELIGRALVIAKLDFWDGSLQTKVSFVDCMQWAWNEYTKKDNIFDWFKDHDSRCRFAWDWLLEKKGKVMDGRRQIVNYKGLLMFYDSLGWLEADNVQRKFVPLENGRMRAQHEWTTQHKEKIELGWLLVGNAQKELDVANIRKKWNQQQRRKKREAAGETQINFEISVKTVAELDRLAKMYDVSRTKIIETLVRRATEDRINFNFEKE